MYVYGYKKISSKSSYLHTYIYIYTSVHMCLDQRGQQKVYLFVVEEKAHNYLLKCNYTEIESRDE